MVGKTAGSVIRTKPVALNCASSHYSLPCSLKKTKKNFIEECSNKPNQNNNNNNKNPTTDFLRFQPLSTCLFHFPGDDMESIRG